MALFRYKIVDKAGQKSETLIEAETQAEAVSKLSARGVFPLEFLGHASHLDDSSKGLFKPRNSFDAYDFTNRLVPLLRTHIPIEKGLGIIADGMATEQSREVVNDLRKGLHEGKKLSLLIRNHGRRFPRLYANLIEAGEESGTLPEVVKELQRFLNESKELKNFLISNSIYPVILLSVTLMVVLLLFTVFIPKFASIFMDMGKELPLLMNIMVGISDLAINFWWLWTGLFAALLFGIVQIKRDPRFQAWWNTTVLKIPLFGKIIETVEVSRFIRTLSVLIKNHVHLLNTVSISSRVIGNSAIKESLSNVAVELREGKSLSFALEKSPYIPKVAVQMLRIGEESGTTGEMLEEVATQIEGDLRENIKRLLSLFEPLMILFMAGVILIVVLSIFMAVMEMNEF